MILTIDQSKIDNNKKYQDTFIVYSYDDGNKIKLPKNSTYRVLFRNKVGVLPIVDQFSGDTYLLNNVMYQYFGLNTVEFIDLSPTRETVLLVEVEVNVSIQNMNASKIGTSYIYDLNMIVEEVKRNAFESNKEIDRTKNSFVNRLNVDEKEINKRLNDSTEKLEIIEQQVETSNESLTLIGNQLKVIDEFLVDVVDKSQLVDDKYQQFDDNVTTANGSLTEILGNIDVKLKNEIVNGDFALDSDKNGIADGFDGGVNTKLPRIENGRQYWTPSIAAYSGSIRTNKYIPFIFTNKYYLNFIGKNIGSIYIAATQAVQGATGSVDGKSSTMFVNNIETGSQILSFYGKTANVESYLSKIILVDLTNVFGAGNEPTKSEMDTLINILGGWFDGEITLTQMQQLNWLLKLIRQNALATTALGGTIL